MWSSTSRSRAQAPAASPVRRYKRNVLTSRLREWAVWLLFNGRYAFIYCIGLGGRLADLPKRNERPLVAGLLLLYGSILTVGIIFQFGSLLSIFKAPLLIGLPLMYIVGAYYLVMEYPGGEAIVGTALFVDLILQPGNLILQTLNVLIFAAFLLMCVSDWREVLRLPKNRKKR